MVPNHATVTRIRFLRVVFLSSSTGAHCSCKGLRPRDINSLTFAADGQGHHPDIIPAINVITFPLEFQSGVIDARKTDTD